MDEINEIEYYRKHLGQGNISVLEESYRKNQQGYRSLEDALFFAEVGYYQAVRDLVKDLERIQTFRDVHWPERLKKQDLLQTLEDYKRRLGERHYRAVENFYHSESQRAKSLSDALYISEVGYYLAIIDQKKDPERIKQFPSFWEEKQLLGFIELFQKHPEYRENLILVCTDQDLMNQINKTN